MHVCSHTHEWYSNQYHAKVSYGKNLSAREGVSMRPIVRATPRQKGG